MFLRRILYFAFILTMPLSVYAQHGHYSDSVVESVQNTHNYHQKIMILQSSIRKIYLTKFDATITLARLGYQLAYGQRDTVNQGDFLRIIGGAINRKGNIDSATHYYYRALKLLEQSKNTKKLGLIYDDMARMYRKLNQPNRALSFYDKALHLYNQSGDLEGIARIYNESGVVFGDEGNYTEANKRFEKSLEIQMQRKDSVGIGYSLEFLGDNQLRLKNYKKAQDYLYRALGIREKLKDDFALMLSYTSLGEYYKATQKLVLSNSYFTKSNTLAKKIQFSDIQTYNYEQIMGNYEALGDYKQAYNSLKASYVLHDSLYNAEKLKNVEEITTKYETAEKEKQILQQQATISYRNFWIFGLVALTLIIGLTGFLLYKQQVLKNIRQQKDNELKLAVEKIESYNRLQEQRMAISRDLHDNIGAQLSFIISAIDTTRYYIKDKNEQVVFKLNSISDFARETIQELRDTIWAMNKSGITLGDLLLRMANYTEKAGHSYPATQLSVTEGEKLPKELKYTSLQGLNIFRIIQEAINNALKYAAAAHIQIKVTEQQNSIEFLIMDDGKGFIESQITAGNGLVNMRKRANDLGGTLILESDMGKGTTIMFDVQQRIDSYEKPSIDE